MLEWILHELNGNALEVNYALILKLCPRRTLGSACIIQPDASMSKKRDDSGICSYNGRGISFTKMNFKIFVIFIKSNYGNRNQKLRGIHILLAGYPAWDPFLSLPLRGQVLSILSWCNVLCQSTDQQPPSSTQTLALPLPYCCLVILLWLTPGLKMTFEANDQGSILWLPFQRVFVCRCMYEKWHWVFEFKANKKFEVHPSTGWLFTVCFFNLKLLHN